MQFEHSTFKIVSTDAHEHDDYYSIGKSVYNQIDEDDLKGILVLSACGIPTFKLFSEGLNSENNNSHCVLGGLASSVNNLEQAFVIVNGQIKKNEIIVLGIYGNEFHMEYGLNKESTLYLNENTPLLAIGQLNSNGLCHGHDEINVETKLTYLPSQTKVIGFYSKSDVIYRIFNGDNKSKPFIMLYENNVQQANHCVSKILDGHKVSKKILAGIKDDINKIIECHKRPPKLAVIYIENNSSSIHYLTNIKKACKDLGISLECYPFAPDVEHETLIPTIEALNQDTLVDGILLQLPLPENLDANAIIDHIAMDKDIDGMHPYNLGLIMQGKPFYQPCATQAVMLLLDSIQTDLKGKHVVVVGASNVGKPLVVSLINAHCTVSSCNVYTPNLYDYVKKADILITAVGKTKLIKGRWIKQGAIVIDIGTTLLPNGTIEGDVEFKLASQKAAWITPVPGGLGPVTVAVLLQNLLKARLKEH